MSSSFGSSQAVKIVSPDLEGSPTSGLEKTPEKLMLPPYGPVRPDIGKQIAGRYQRLIHEVTHIQAIPRSEEKLTMDCLP